MAKVKNELQVIELDKFDISQLPELQNKKEEVAKRLKEFKYVAIKDNATYEEAKKSRTGARTIRTELQAEQKNVNKKIKDFILEPVKEAYTQLIEEVLPVENKQQEEVSRWEDIKEQERLAKVRAEEERVAKIREEIVNFENQCNAIIKSSTAENVKENKVKLDVIFSNEYDFMEFKQLYEMAKQRVQTSFDEKCGEIQKQEEQRLENERIKAEKLEQERIFNIKQSVSEWKNKWLSKLSTLTFEESKTVQKEFSEEKPLDCQEFQEDYAIVRVEIQSLIDKTIENLKTLEENRLKMEKFQKEKDEFEQKQKEDRFQERTKQLKKIGFVLNESNFAYQKGLNYLNVEDIKNASNELWLRELEDAKNTPEFKDKETPQELTNENFDFDKSYSDSIEKLIPSQEPEFEEIPENNVDKMIEANENRLASMNYNDKLELLTNWLQQQDEIVLDELIQNYLN